MINGFKKYIAIVAAGLCLVPAQAQEVAVADSAENAMLLLMENVSYLNEVVVVGYGTQRRKELTGAISTVSKAHLDYNVAPSVDALLSGAVAGMSVTQASGQPGAGASIRIRGGNSINAGNDPLYVIDGFIFYSDNSSVQTGVGVIEGEINPLSLLNPSDIASIEILKDVSATAIYGSRGSNGVIIVTTKKGQRDGASVNYRYSVGFSRSARKLDLLTGPQWARLQKDYFLNKGQYADSDIPSLPTYDWQDGVLQTGVAHTHDVSLSGGGETTRYFLSGNYLKQDGVILNSGFNRFVGRVNVEKKLSRIITTGVAVTATKSTQNTLTTFEEVNYNDSPYSHGIANSLTYALYIPPVVPLYDANGGYNYSNPFEYAYLRHGDQTANPLSDLKNSSAQNILSVFLGSVYAEISPLEGLTARVNIGGNLSYVTQNYFAPSYTAIGLSLHGVGGVGNKRQQAMLYEYTLSYNKTFADKHSFDILVGYTQETTKKNYASASSSNYVIEKLGFNNLQDGEEYLSPITGASEGDLYSLLGRLNYSLLGRYHLTANFRSDYSSRMAKKHRRKNFPSIGLSWNINEEPFLANNHTLSLLKLRLSGGTVGNQEGIGEYEFLQTLTAVRYGGGTAYIVNNSGNENLRWESTAQYNAGVDAGLWKNRLIATVDVYYKKTYDLLLRIPPKLGESNTQLVNAGNVTNKGIELSIDATLLDSRKWRWRVTANAARNINRITALYNDAEEMRVNDVEILKVGESLGQFYGLVFEGVVQQGEDVSKLPTSPSYNTLQPGDPKYRDTNGDNHIDSNDRVVLGSRQPEYLFGLSSTLNYGRFDLYIAFQGTQGNKVYNQLRRFLEIPTDSYNMAATLQDAWTPGNPSNTVPKITQSQFSTELDSRYIEDAAYLRLKTLTIGYSLPIAKKIDLRFFVTAQNLFTLTRYKGYDPEIASGTDLGVYPAARTVLLGANVSF
ncbi:MAG: TonB-dependent receptor [Prevotellaceae bacterium]|jgi:TonB-linked SusC/RagA family outer membrane protein|nr:TonB-dependent receptor [Prevotellaceae bacterium]